VQLLDEVITPKSAAQEKMGIRREPRPLPGARQLRERSGNLARTRHGAAGRVNEGRRRCAQPLIGSPAREPLFAAITFLTYLTLAGVPLAIILLLTDRRDSGTDPLSPALWPLLPLGGSP
jgi:hypothetical protein